MHIVLYILHIEKTTYSAYFAYCFTYPAYNMTYFFAYYFAYYFAYFFAYFCILSGLHILHILHVYIFCILYIYIYIISRKQPWLIVSPSLLPLLLVFSCEGPAVYVPSPTSIVTVMGFTAGSSWKIGWFNQRSRGFIYMQNITDMTVIDPPSTFAYSAYYLTY